MLICMGFSLLVQMSLPAHACQLRLVGSRLVSRGTPPATGGSVPHLAPLLATCRLACACFCLTRSSAAHTYAICCCNVHLVNVHFLLISSIQIPPLFISRSYDADYANYHKAPQQLSPQVGSFRN